jgi:phosphoribosyl-AMP cyclohydrolase / phosphoribosyl-ATP pyrophosphohydrolase
VALDWLKRDDKGLVTVVVQDRHTGLVRMVAHADDAALSATLETGFGHFFSRSRQRMWKKGEESGHFLRVHEVWADCDADCIVYLVDPEGPSCHTGRETCFFRRLDADGSAHEQPTVAAPTFPRLTAELEARRAQSPDVSYTRSLLDKGAVKIGEKIREEGDELARAIESESDARVVSEAGDVIYHLLVGLLSREQTLRDVQVEIARRFGMSGLAEKAARTR